MTTTTKLSRLVVACGKLVELYERLEHGDLATGDERDEVLAEIVAARIALDDNKPGAS